MDAKLFEIRDRATCIPAMAIRLRNRTPKEFHLLRRAGYGAKQIGGPEDAPGKLAKGLEPYVLLCGLSDHQIEYDPYGWRGARTMPVAHKHIIEHWAELTSGDVIDVEFILGERSEPNASEMAAG